MTCFLNLQKWWQVLATTLPTRESSLNSTVARTWSIICKNVSQCKNFLLKGNSLKNSTWKRKDIFMTEKKSFLEVEISRGGDILRVAKRIWWLKAKICLTIRLRHLDTCCQKTLLCLKSQYKLTKQDLILLKKVEMVKGQNLKINKK